jgi:lipoprotein Spr/probable lipoprotein NlpC
VTPGDVVAFRTGGRDINHVGIMVDAQRFIHASTSKGVIVSSLTEKYWRSSYVTARRVVTR